MNSSSGTAAGPTLHPEENQAAAATQAAWRFFNNDAVTLSALVEPLREAGRKACAESESEFALLVHDWSKIDYKTHEAKTDRYDVTHKHDIGYDLTTALLVDAHTGDPLAPMQMQLKTADALHSTAENPPSRDEHHLEQLQPTFEEAARWELPRRVVHLIDREADSLGHFRQWDPEHLFLVRGDDRRVLWNEESWLISEIVADCDERGLFEDVREVAIEGQTGRQEVAEADIVLHRPHKTRIAGKQRDVPGRPIRLRLVMARVVNSENEILSEWILLTNVPAAEVDASRIALWYYWRWLIETYFKLLKSAGQELESWQQETGLAIARRLLVASMACVVVWQLERDKSPEAEELKAVLIRLSGRQMKPNVPYTSPALLAGYFVLLAIYDLLEHTDYNLKTLKALATQAIPFMDST